jgi:predicted transcriptional regulator
METENALTNIPSLQEKISRVLALKKISLADIEDFNDAERNYLGEITTEMLQQLKDVERDNFIDKIAPIVPSSTNDQIWEHNHLVIGQAIARLIAQYGSMPPKFIIARETGLSRQTVAKHLTGYKTHPQYLAEVEQFKFMTPKILAGVCHLAGNGDMKAARLYFEMVGAINKRKPDTVINEQNNYIQINNTILSQENLKQLSKEQLNQIEHIISGIGGK